MHRKLLTTVNNRRMVLVASLLSPTGVRDAFAHALFECPALAPHAVLFAPSHLLCALVFNTRTCLVVDEASAETLIFPVPFLCIIQKKLDNFCMIF